MVFGWILDSNSSRSFRKTMLVLGVGVTLGMGFGILLLWGFGYQFPPPSAQPVLSLTSIRKGMSAPDFELLSLVGDGVRLSDYKGSVVLVNFWATWCAPCRLEMPDFQKVYEKSHPDMKILAVNVGETPEQVQPFIEELGLTFDILLDAESEVSELYNVLGYPTSLVIGRDGNIVAYHVGYLNSTQLTQYLEEAGISR